MFPVVGRDNDFAGGIVGLDFWCLICLAERGVLGVVGVVDEMDGASMLDIAMDFDFILAPKRDSRVTCPRIG